MYKNYSDLKYDIYKNAKPFIKWAGGKRQLVTQILNTIPQKFSNEASFNFVEPFIGSAAVFFNVVRLYSSSLDKIIISDTNLNLINVYKIVRDKPIELIKILESLRTQYSSYEESEREKFYYKLRDEFNNCTNDSNEIRNAALFILLNKLGYNGLYRVNKSGKFNVPFGRYKSPKIFDEKSILSDSEILKRTEILNIDFEKTIDYINGNLTLYYLDPPYKPISQTSSFNSYSRNIFDDEEQKRLKTFCDLLTKQKIHFILSNSDLKNYDRTNNFFDELYGKYSIKRVEASRAINSNPQKRGKINELIISNQNILR